MTASIDLLRGRPLALGTVLVVWLALAAACGDDDGTGPGPRADSGPPPAEDMGTPPREDAAPPDAGRPDAGPPPTDAGPAAEADIREALACGTPMGVHGMGRPGELQLQEMDNTRFPDAVCNDGTPAVMRFRPYRGEENRTRWVISLRGGGYCGGAGACAARWCSCRTMAECPFAQQTTNFTLENMSGGGRRSEATGGVLRREGQPNPLADYNHVELVYCSSDSWGGVSRGVTYTTTHPRTGEEVSYTLHFLGARIFEAGIAALRQDGGGPLMYTLDGGAVPLPDLDEATQVLFEGDSAGGAGVIRHLDHLGEILRAHHVGGGDGPEIVGLIDAVVGPDWSQLDWSMSVGASAGVDTYPEVLEYISGNEVLANGYNEDSCVRWHMENEPDSVNECLDETHLIRHHITTPFFVRMALLDGLIASSYEQSGARDPELGPFVLTELPSGARLPLTFARVLQRELAAFSMLPMTAEEGAAMTRAPGVFGPACTKHDTIHDDSEVYGVTITPPGTTTPLALFDVLGNWTRELEPSVVLTMDPMRADTVCPP
ncbi:MAG: hypothetical protein IT379_36825 [Deltaproteobacteria bacterium]|nr:hypothetical protein [Deltaproteobacteria bacterium]